MAAHRYWRVWTRATPSGGYFGADELSFRSSADADLSVGGAALSSPPIDANYTAPLAFDKTTSTLGFLSTNSLPAWLGYDHGSPVDVASVVLTVLDPTYSPLPGLILLQWSDDGVTWVTQGTHLVADTISFPAGAVVRFTPLDAGTPVTRMLDRLMYRRAAPTPQQYPPRAIAPSAVTLRHDPVDGGKFKAVVYTDVNALPTDQPISPRYVRLHDFTGQGRLVRAGWSKMVGGQAVCVFENIRQGNYYAVGFDHTGAYDAEVASNLPLEPM